MRKERERERRKEAEAENVRGVGGRKEKQFFKRCTFKRVEAMALEGAQTEVGTHGITRRKFPPLPSLVSRSFPVSLSVLRPPHVRDACCALCTSATLIQISWKPKGSCTRSNTRRCVCHTSGARKSPLLSKESRRQCLVWIILKTKMKGQSVFKI